VTPRRLCKKVKSLLHIEAAYIQESGNNMRLSRIQTGLVVALGLALPAVGAIAAHPGTINYVEGSVSVNGETVAPSSIGSADLRPGAVLKTQSGKAEVLLTPGVFLRIGNHSQVRMVSNGLTDTRVAVDSGTALLEATEVHEENNIQVASSSLTTTVEKQGLYRFDADRSAVAVFDGKAKVREGDSSVEIGKGKEVVGTHSGVLLKQQKFDRDEARKTDELYKWSSLRSKYLSEASAATAQRVVVEPGAWYGSGWYWNPGFRSYSWLPAGDGFYSPFGYGFYSPWSAWSPVYAVPRYRAYPRAGYSGVRPSTGYHGGGRSGGRHR
jgi:hypothetical protein